jgi:hypothetical protein
LTITADGSAHCCRLRMRLQPLGERQFFRDTCEYAST